MADWIDLGGVEFRIASGGPFKLDCGSVFGVVPKPLWSRLVQADEQNRLSMIANCPLIRSNSELTLVDTGVGGKLNPKEADIFGLVPGNSIARNLRSIGVEPEAVDRVVLSHLHLDHVGGATEWGSDGVARVSFPNARVVVQQGDWEDACANRSTMRNTYRSENLQPLKQSGKLELVNGDAEFGRGIRVRLTPGHTRYHQVVVIEGDRGAAVYMGDILPTWAHLSATYNQAFDMSSYENMLRKCELLTEAAQKGWWVIPAHDTTCAVARVRQLSDELWEREDD